MYRITYWKTPDGEYTSGEDHDAEEYQDLVENGTLQFILGVTAAPYRAFPCDDGHNFLLLEVWDEDDWRELDCDDILNMHAFPIPDSGLKVDIDGFEGFFENPGEDFMEGLRYFRGRIYPKVTWS